MPRDGAGRNRAGRRAPAFRSASRPGRPPRRRRRRGPCLPAGRAGSPRAAGGRGVRDARAAPPGGALRGASARGNAATALRARGQLPGRQGLHAARRLRLPAHARGPRSVPRRGGTSRGDLRAARRPRSRDRRHTRHRVRRVGAERTGRERRGRLQLLGRPSARDAHARLIGHLGDLHPGRRGGRRVQVRDPHRGRPPSPKGRPLRLPHGRHAAHRLDRASLAPRLA